MKLKNQFFIIIEKLPYRLREKFFKIYRLIFDFPNIFRYSLKDFSKINLIGCSFSIDASTMCQLQCPICPTSKRINKEGVIGWGYLKFKDFKNFIDKFPQIKSIELSNWGEIFLNPDLKQIIKYAYDKKINLTAYTGVNLNNVKRDMLESLVKYKFRCLNISIDGATSETYKIYRRGGDFINVIKNIKIINFFKKKYRSEFPKLIWQFIIFGHNEHELPKARTMAQKLGMAFIPKLNKSTIYSPIIDKDFVRQESGLGVATRKEFANKYRNVYLHISCYQFWTSPQINWNGKLLGCCENIWFDFGNVFKEGLRRCLKSDEYIYTKQVILGKKSPREGIPCLKCFKYNIIKKYPLKKTNIILKL